MGSNDGVAVIITGRCNMWRGPAWIYQECSHYQPSDSPSSIPLFPLSPTSRPPLVPSTASFQHNRYMVAAGATYLGISLCCLVGSAADIISGTVANPVRPITMVCQW